MVDAAPAGREAAAWAVLGTVPDPEVPALSLCDLGVVREVHAAESGVEVVLTPTYSGCPATEVIAESVRAALEGAGLGPARVTHRLAPAWTTDWMSDAGRRKLKAYGIAPPPHLGDEAAGVIGSEKRGEKGGEKGGVQPIRLRPRGIECPRCGSTQTERLSAFGSTACKALHRCLDCREPFEHFKPI